MFRVTKKPAHVQSDFAQTLDWQQAFEILLGELQSLLAYRRVLVLMWDSKQKLFVVKADDAGKMPELTMDSAHLLARNLQQLRAPLIRDQLPTDASQEIIQAFDWLAVQVALPLMVCGELIGIVLIEHEQPGALRRHSVSALADLAFVAAPALHHACLYHTALREIELLKQDLASQTSEHRSVEQQQRDIEKAKNDFLSISSHQLYTPLTAIRGYLSMLQEGTFGKLTAAQRPIIDILDQSASRLIALIRNLLDISRIEGGRFEMSLSEVDVVQMAQELVHDLMPNAKNKGLRLEFSPPPVFAPLIIGDEGRLRQVFLNLIDNAIKYTDQGTITVMVEVVARELELRVEDTGKGLTQQEISQLFTKFARVGGAQRFKTEGSGLGLYVAAQVVREHKGEIVVQSNGLGRGSIFTVRLPLQNYPQSLKLEDEINTAQGQGAR